MLAAVPQGSDDAVGFTEDLATALLTRYESGTLPVDAVVRDLDETIALTAGLLARHWPTIRGPESMTPERRLCSPSPVTN